MKVVISTDKVNWESNDFGSEGENSAEREELTSVIKDKHGVDNADRANEERAYFQIRLAEPGYRQLMDLYLNGADHTSLKRARILLYLLHTVWQECGDDPQQVARVLHAASVFHAIDENMTNVVKVLFNSGSDFYWRHWAPGALEKSEDDALKDALNRRFCYTRLVQRDPNDGIRQTERLVDLANMEELIGMLREAEELSRHASAYEVGSAWVGVYKPLHITEVSATNL